MLRETPRETRKGNAKDVVDKYIHVTAVIVCTYVGIINHR